MRRRRSTASGSCSAASARSHPQRKQSRERAYGRSAASAVAEPVLARSRRRPLWYSRYACRSASPGQSRPHSSAGRSGSARTCASAAAPTTNASAMRHRAPDRARVIDASRRVVERACTRRPRRRIEELGRRAPRHRRRVGPSTTRTARRRPSRRRPVRPRARQVVGPRPHAFAQLGHAQPANRVPQGAAVARRRRAPRPSTTPSSQSPSHCWSCGRQAPVLRGLAAARPARPARRRRRRPPARPARPCGSARPRRALGDAEQRAPLHEPRAASIRGGCIPSRRLAITERVDERAGRAAHGPAYYVLASSVAKV